MVGHVVTLSDPKNNYHLQAYVGLRGWSVCQDGPTPVFITMCTKLKILCKETHISAYERQIHPSDSHMTCQTIQYNSPRLNRSALSLFSSHFAKNNRFSYPAPLALYNMRRYFFGAMQIAPYRQLCVSPGPSLLVSVPPKPQWPERGDGCWGGPL